MHELILWKKQEIDKLRQDLDQLFRRFRDEFGVPRSLFKVAESVSIDLSETEDSLVLQAELPAIRPEDINISVTEDRLTLNAKIKEDVVEEREGYQRVARSSRSFARSIKLPCRIETEAVQASYEGNMLKITLPKCKAKKGRGIKIQIK
jgi:HSP20 family protein